MYFNLNDLYIKQNQGSLLDIVICSKIRYQGQEEVGTSGSFQ